MYACVEGGECGVWGVRGWGECTLPSLSLTLSPSLPALDAGRRLETASFLLLSEVHQPPG